MSLRLDWLWDCETLTGFIGSSCGELVRLLSLPLRLALVHTDDWFACRTDDEILCRFEHPATTLVRSLHSGFLLAGPLTNPKNLIKRHLSLIYQRPALEIQGTCKLCVPDVWILPIAETGLLKITERIYKYSRNNEINYNLGMFEIYKIKKTYWYFTVA